MLLRFQKAVARGNYATGNQAFSMRLRFLTIRDSESCLVISHIYKDAWSLAQAKGLPSLIYDERVLEVRFVRGAAGTMRILTIRDITRAQALTDELAKRFPEDTIVQFNFLPTLHAQLALSHNGAAKALEVLQAAAPYELGDVGTADFYPIFVRGQAYLAAHQGGEAATEFQKILDHRGVVGNEPIGALAHLGLARAYAMQGDTAKAKAAYQDFLTLWKDADPDVPILIAAKSEYAKLQ
jgi:predicted Zn-dependent protease